MFFVKFRGTDQPAKRHVAAIQYLKTSVRALRSKIEVMKSRKRSSLRPLGRRMLMLLLQLKDVAQDLRLLLETLGEEGLHEVDLAFLQLQSLPTYLGLFVEQLVLSPNFLHVERLQRVCVWGIHRSEWTTALPWHRDGGGANDGVVGGRNWSCSRNRCRYLCGHRRWHASVCVCGHADGVIAAIDIGYRRYGLMVDGRCGRSANNAVVIELSRLLLKLRLIICLELLLLLLLLLQLLLLLWRLKLEQLSRLGWGILLQLLLKGNGAVLIVLVLLLDHLVILVRKQLRVEANSAAGVVVVAAAVIAIAAAIVIGGSAWLTGQSQALLLLLLNGLLLWLLLQLLCGRIIPGRCHVAVVEQRLWRQRIGVLGPVQVLQDAIDNVVLLPARSIARRIRLQLFFDLP